MLHIKLSLVVVLALTILSSACSNENKAEPKGVIPEHQLKALEKAKNTEQLLLEAEANRRKEID